MKHLNGPTYVHFTNAVIDFDIPLEEAEKVMAQKTHELRKLALLELLRRSEIDAASITNGTYVLAEFIKCVGVAMAEQRGQELRMLKAPTGASGNLDHHIGTPSPSGRL